jgi:HSP20 family molecular chaperone IbpA
MQTTQRSKREEGTGAESSRGERPSRIAGHDIGFGQYGQGAGTTWGQVGYTPVIGFAQSGLEGPVRFGSPNYGLPPAPPFTALTEWGEFLNRGIAIAAAQGQALLSAVQRPINSLLPGFAVPTLGTAAMPFGTRAPAVDIVDEGSEFVCQVELPGVKTENIEVSCFERGLLVTAHAEPEIDVGALVQAERGIKASYRRAINVPAPVQPSGSKATLREGILTVNLPKLTPTEGPRRVPVNAGTP